MREMGKYRGKRKDGRGWAYGFLFCPPAFPEMALILEPSKYTRDQYCGREFFVHGWDYSDLFHVVKVIPKTVGEFTGLCDKNGKEGWRNDRVQILRFDGTFLITWDEFNAKYYLKSEQLNHIVDIRYLPEEGEIIGNAHDNPELLSP